MSHLFEDNPKFPGRCYWCGFKRASTIHAPTVVYAPPVQPVLYEQKQK